MKITKKYFKAILMVGCLFLACHVIAMGKMSEQWELHLEKKIPYADSALHTFYFSDENGNDYLISDGSKHVIFRQNNQVIKTFDDQVILRRTMDGRFYLLQKTLSLKILNQMDSVFEDQLTVCDYRGEVMWSAKGIGQGDYYLSPKGDYVVYFVSPEFHPADPPTFINKDGFINKDVVEMKTKDIQNWDIEYSKIVLWSFSKTGSLVCVGLYRGSKKPALFVLFDSNGDPLRYFQGEIVNPVEADISDDENKIAVTGIDMNGQNKIEVHDISTAKIIWTNKYAADSLHTVWQQDTNLLLVSGVKNNSYRLLNPDDGSIKWEKELCPCKEFRADSIRSANGCFIALGRCKKDDYSWLTFIDSAGKMLIDYRLQFSLLSHEVNDIVVLIDKVIVYDETGIFVFYIKKK